MSKKRAESQVSSAPLLLYSKRSQEEICILNFAIPSYQLLHTLKQPIDFAQARFRSRSVRGDIRPRSRIRKHRNSNTPKTFSQKLGLAALVDHGMVRGKIAPLYTDRPVGGGKPKPTIRIRPLQHMIVIHLKRVIAGQVNEIVQTETATPEMMEQVRKTMKQYGEFGSQPSGLTDTVYDSSGFTRP